MEHGLLATNFRPKQIQSQGKNRAISAKKISFADRLPIGQKILPFPRFADSPILLIPRFSNSAI
jgi:hypothetical protein